jgi:hypothetical protein
VLQNPEEDQVEAEPEHVRHVATAILFSTLQISQGQFKEKTNKKNTTISLVFVAVRLVLRLK